MKHTHRGTCQACGRVQAITRSPYASNVIAKHGYTVEWGFFNGVCQGSLNYPLEQEHTLTDQLIVKLRERAVEADKLAVDIEAGKVELQWYKRGPAFAKIPCKREELDAYRVKEQIEAAAYNAKMVARGARDHASMLAGLSAHRFGQPLYPVSSKPALGVGTRVRIGGKKGWIGEVLEIRNDVAQGCGPFLNGRVMPHAILKRPDGSRIALPVRTIRMSAIVSQPAT